MHHTEIKRSDNFDILFIDGLEARHLNSAPTFLGFLFPIAAVLEENKYSFKILNLSTLKDYSKSGLIEELKKISFKAIGISTNSDNIRYVYKISRILKSIYPKIPIIIGGPQATYTSERILNETDIDVIVRHDGEIKLIKLLDYYIKDQGRLQYIKGITFKNKNEIIYNEDDIPININTLPTPQYKILIDKKYWVIPEKCFYDNFDDFLQKIILQNNIFVASRGCPYSCTFCVEGNSMLKQRTRDTDKLIEDLRYFIQVTGLKYIMIGDDTFTSSPKRVKELCSKIEELRKEHNFIWFAEGRVNILAKHPELLKIMVDSGLYKLQLGIESGNQKVLDIYNKKITLDQIRKVVKEASKYENILLHGNLILGNPGENFSEFKESVEFAKELIALSGYKMDFGNGYLTPFVGTDIRNNPQKYNLEFLCEDFEFHRTSFIEPLCKPKEMTLTELSNLFGYSHGELMKFVKNNIFKLPKKKIDERMRFDRKYGGKTTRISSKFWAKTFYGLIQIRRYYSIFSQSSTIKEHIKNEDIEKIKKYIPLRLWDINYNIEKDSYHFQSMKGEHFEIKGQEKYLWELASGKNTLLQISQKTFLSANDTDILKIFNFYQKLEENFALIFKSY